MYVLGADIIDPNILLRAAAFFYSKINKHVNDTEHISKETIKYYIDRILEITLALDDYANDVYDDLSDEEKKSLEQYDIDRNKYLFERHDGRVIGKGADELIKFLKNTEIRYRNIRQKAESRVNNSQENEI